MYPALAIVAALGPSAEVLWVGGEGGMEASLVPREGLAFEAVPAAGVHGVGPRALPGNLWRLARGLPAARGVIRRFRPDAILATGGYVAVPVVLASGRLPKVLYVPDLEPGLALRLLARTADVVAVTAEEARRFYPSGKRLLVSGYPTRPGLRVVDRERARRELGLEMDTPVVLVSGGSRGAHSINLAVWGCLPALLERAQVVHLTGDGDWPLVAEVQAGLPPRLAARYRPHAYLHEAMAFALASADLAVARAGASALGELPLFGLPALLVPYPHAWRYQRVNADYLARRGAALRLEDGELGQRLLPMLLELLGDPARLQTMAAAAQALATPQAARTIAAEIERLAGGSGRPHD